MLNVEIDITKVQKALRIAPVQLRSELADTIDHTSRSFLKKFYRTRFKGPPGLTMGGRGNLFSKFRKRVIGSNQGTLSNRIKANTVIGEIVGSNISTEDMGMEIFTNSEAAKIHEFGGTISGRMIVPLPQSPAGERSDRRLLRSGKLIYLRIGGNQFLAKVDKKAHKARPAFIIKNSVRIRPRLGFYDTWGSMQNQTIERLNNAVQKALSKV
ncbi:MAG: hypothetical protein Q8R48_08070 [Candidatus Omnitrophota bacterium]|nr:hypothetical protein [Candidatus Omnitrophota bacterium]